MHNLLRHEGPFADALPAGQAILFFSLFKGKHHEIMDITHTKGVMFQSGFSFVFVYIFIILALYKKN